MNTRHGNVVCSEAGTRTSTVPPLFAHGTASLWWCARTSSSSRRKRSLWLAGTGPKKLADFLMDDWELMERFMFADDASGQGGG